MNNLSFSKNSFIKSEPATIANPVNNNPNKFGRRTLEEIKGDMHSINKSKIQESNPKLEDVKPNRLNNLNSLRSFKEWNKKW